MRILWLRCDCGRNLAEVTDGDMRREHQGLLVSPRPNVDQDIYRPPLPAGYGKPPTYTWRCRCGKTPTSTHDRIVRLWAQHRHDPRPRVAVTLGG